jgi:UDP-N-acetyl-D-galactosamine dehydrogenase
VLDDYHDSIDWLTEVPAGMDYYIICVPTPDERGVPDYSYVDAACQAVIEVAGKRSTLVLESTVAPGTCRDRIGGMLLNADTLLIAYSPERINPSETAYEDMRNSQKLVAVEDQGDARTDDLAKLYKRVFRGGVTLMGDTRVAELAKCFENFQRDMNIALMNELSMQCHRHGVVLADVMTALATKPSSPVFHSGMVGGHCIPVDPYYLAQWYDPRGYGIDLPSLGRHVNERYIKYVANLCRTQPVDGPRNVLIVGLTYKPDIADTRNSGSTKIAQLLEKEGIRCDVYDPVVDLTQLPIGRRYNIVVAAVNHSVLKGRTFLEYLPLTIDCTAINVGQFARHQMSGIQTIINL